MHVTAARARFRSRPRNASCTASLLPHSCNIPATSLHFSRRWLLSFRSLFCLLSPFALSLFSRSSLSLSSRSLSSHFWPSSLSFGYLFSVFGTLLSLSLFSHSYLPLAPLFISCLSLSSLSFQSRLALSLNSLVSRLSLSPLVSLFSCRSFLSLSLIASSCSFFFRLFLSSPPLLPFFALFPPLFSPFAMFSLLFSLFSFFPSSLLSFRSLLPSSLFSLSFRSLFSHVVLSLLFPSFSSAGQRLDASSPYQRHAPSH